MSDVKLGLDLGRHDGLEPELVVAVLGCKGASPVPVLENVKISRLEFVK
jgi:hypothetical protein